MNMGGDGSRQNQGEQSCFRHWPLVILRHGDLGLNPSFGDFIVLDEPGWQESWGSPNQVSPHSSCARKLDKRELRFHRSGVGQEGVLSPLVILTADCLWATF